MTDQDSAHLLELETSLHRKEIRNSADALSRLLADEFVEFGSSGRIFNKSTIIQSLSREEIDQKISVEDFVAQELAAGVVLVTYTATRHPAFRSLRSSIWKLVDGKWRMIFHQGTRIP